MEIIITIITLVLMERALCVWLYDWVPTCYNYTEYLLLDILYRLLKFMWAFSFILLIWMWMGAFALITLAYTLAFILKKIVIEWIRKDNGE